MRLKRLGSWALVFGWICGCSMMGSGGERVKVSILIDLDPASPDRTVIVESIAADPQGVLYLPDRVSGNILRVDPKAPKPVTVGQIAARQIKGKKTNADAAGLAFNNQGDLFVAVGPFSEVVQIRKADLNPNKPAQTRTFATGVEGANGVAFDDRGNLYVTGGRSGKIYQVGPKGGAAHVFAEIPPYTRKLPDGKSEQPIVANGIAVDASGNLFVADTARGAIWKVAIGKDGKPQKPAMLAQSPLLEGADGLAFDRRWHLWVVANERNALLLVGPDAKVEEAAKDGGKGPLEFPSAIVFVGETAYISNYDTPRRDNMDANGKTALEGIGASIAQFTL